MPAFMCYFVIAYSLLLLPPHLGCPLPSLNALNYTLARTASITFFASNVYVCLPVPCANKRKRNTRNWQRGGKTLPLRWKARCPECPSKNAIVRKAKFLSASVSISDGICSESCIRWDTVRCSPAMGSWADFFFLFCCVFIGAQYFVVVDAFRWATPAHSTDLTRCICQSSQRAHRVRSGGKANDVIATGRSGLRFAQRVKKTRWN